MQSSAEKFRLDRAVDDYILYLGGISWLHNPEATRPAHSINPQEEPDTLVCRAYERMRGAGQKILRNAHEIKGLAPAVGQLDQASDRLRQVVDTAFNDEVSLERIKLLLPADDHELTAIRPAAFLDEVPHDYLAKGRAADKLTVPMLMGGVSMHKDIELHLNAPIIQR